MKRRTEDSGPSSLRNVPRGTSEIAYYLNDWLFRAAFALLPGGMDSTEARAMLLAIALQESDLRERAQGGGGPARGFWQFERAGGVAEILRHKTTGPIMAHVCATLQYRADANTCHAAIEHNDVLATCFARLLLFVDPRALPSPIETQKGWNIYLANWRPGKPGPARWPSNFAEGWRIVKGV